MSLTTLVCLCSRQTLTIPRLSSALLPTERATASAAHSKPSSTDRISAVSETDSFDVRTIPPFEPSRTTLAIPGLWFAVSRLSEHIHTARASHGASISGNAPTTQLPSCRGRAAAIHASRWCERPSSHRQRDASILLSERERAHSVHHERGGVLSVERFLHGRQLLLLMSNATRHDMTLGQVHAIANSFHTVTMNEKKCKLQIATNRFSPHMRAPSRTSSTLQRQAFFCYFSGHTYFNLQENSASIQRERERARERPRERERARARESQLHYLFLCCAVLSCACVCVYSGSPHFFFIREKKIQIFLVGWLLAHTPPSSFLFFFFGLLATHIYMIQKMYILGNKGFSLYFSFQLQYLPRVGRVG